MKHIRMILLGIIGTISGLRVAGTLAKQRAAGATSQGEGLGNVPDSGAPRLNTRTRRNSRGAVAQQPPARRAGTAAANAAHTVGKLLPNSNGKSKPVSNANPATAPSQHADMSKISGVWGYLMELAKRFGTDQCGAWAAALSFFSILSIPPVLLTGIAVLGFLIQDPDQAAEQVQEVVANLLPGSGSQKTAQEIIEQLNIRESARTLRDSSGWAFALGIASLVWSALQIFVNAIVPMNAAYRAEETRGFIKQRVVCFGLLIGAGLLFLLSLLPASGAAIINAIPIPGVGDLPNPLPPLIRVFFFFVGVAINAVMFALIYRYLPSPAANVNWRHTIFAGGIIAVLWETAKMGFAFYLSNFGNYNKMYGSLGGLVALVFWTYYSCMILLLGAEIANLRADWEDSKASQSNTHGVKMAPPAAKV